MAIAVTNINKGAGTDPFTFSGVTVPAGATIVLAIDDATNSVSNSGCSDSAGNTYTLAISPVQTGGSPTHWISMIVAYNVAALSSGTITMRDNTGTNQIAAIACYLTGTIKSSSALDLKPTKGKSGPATSGSLASGSPAVANEMFLGFACLQNTSGAFTQASGWTSTFSTTSSVIQGGTQLNTGTGALTYNPSWANSRDYNMMIASFKPLTATNQTVSVSVSNSSTMIRSAGKIFRPTASFLIATFKQASKVFFNITTALATTLTEARLAFGSPTAIMNASINSNVSIFYPANKFLNVQSASISINGILQNAISKSLNLTVGSLTALLRSIAKFIGISQPVINSLLQNRVSKQLSFALAPSTSINRGFVKRLNPQIGEAISLQRAIAKIIATLNSSIDVTSIGSAATSAGAPLALDGVAHGSFANPVTCSLTTTDTDDIIVVAICTYAGGGPSAPLVSNVTASGLTFTKRYSTGVVANGASISVNFELWYAVAASALSAKTISASLASGASDVTMIAFGISGADTSSPFDANGSLPKVNNTAGVAGVPAVSGVSTTNANDFLFSVAFMFTPAGLNHPGTGYTDITNFTSSGSSIKMDAMYKIVSAAQSSVAVSWGVGEGGGSFGNICYVDAVKQGFTSPVVASLSGVTVPADSTIFVLASSSGSGGTFTVSDSAGNTYLPVTGGSVQYGKLYYCDGCLALSGGTIQVSGSAADDVSIQACYASGLFTQIDPLDLATSAASGTGTSLSSTSGSPLVAGELFIAAASFSAAASVFTQASGWSQCSPASNTETSTGSGVNQTQQWGYLVANDALAKTYNPTINVSEAWNVPVLASFRPKPSIYVSLNKIMSNPPFAITSALAVSLKNKVGKLIATSIATASSLVTQSFGNRIFTVPVASAVTLQRNLSKIINITRASAVTLRRNMSNTIANITLGVSSTLNNKVGLMVGLATSIPISASLDQFRAFIRSFSAQVGTTTTMAQRNVSKIINVSASSLVTLRRNMSNTIANISLAVNASLRNRINLAISSLATSIPVVASLNQFRSFIRAFTATPVGTITTLQRSANKIINATRSLTVTLQRQIGHINNVVISNTASLIRKTGKVIAATIAPVASLNSIRTFSRIFNIAQGTSVLFATLQGFVISFFQGSSVRLIRHQTKLMTFGLPHMLTLRANVFRAVFIHPSIGSVVTMRRKIGKIIRAMVDPVIGTLFRHVRDISGSTEPALIRSGNNVFLVTVQGHDGDDVQTLYFSTEGKMTVPTDTPANTYYEPRVVDPGNFERHLFSSGTTRGQVSVGEGDVVLASGDSGRSGDTLDYLLNWAFDGYRIIIQSLTNVRQAVTLAKTLFTGSIEQIVTDDAYNQISFKIHDRLSDLSLPLLTNTFVGTTVSGGAGTADGNVDLAGQKKQQCFGNVFNVSGQVANAYDLVWLFSDNALHFLTVKDGGVALTNDGDVANLAALLAWTQVAGHYKTCLALGMARLGSSPVYGITADVVQGATSADRTAAQIAKTMLLDFGISSGDIDGATITALDAKNSAEQGILVSGDTTCLDAATEVLNSIGGYLVPNNLGVFQVGRFEAPAISSPDLALDLDEDTIIGDSLARIATGDDGRGIPTWRVTINYAQNYTVQKDNQLAGSVSDADRTFYANQWRTAPDSDSSVQTRHKLAVDITINSTFAFEADAADEATRQLTLHKVRRDAYKVGVTLDYGADANIGSVVRITSPRFGLSGGQLFVVIGRVDDYENKQIILDVWG